MVSLRWTHCVMAIDEQLLSARVQLKMLSAILLEIVFRIHGLGVLVFEV